MITTHEHTDALALRLSASAVKNDTKTTSNATLTSHPE